MPVIGVVIQLRTPDMKLELVAATPGYLFQIRENNSTEINVCIVSLDSGRIERQYEVPYNNVAYIEWMHSEAL